MSGDNKLLGIERDYQSDGWRTPKHIYASLNAEFEFSLDAACTTDNCLAAQGLYFDLGIDGLVERWSDYCPTGEFIFVNPPFSKVGLWVEKSWHSQCNVVLIVQADTGTRWWHRFVVNCDEIRFYEGRVQFDPPINRSVSSKGTPTKPTALIIFRKNSYRLDGPLHVYLPKPEKIC